jgi:Resolvase, N terminal domain/Recombinase
MSKSQYHCYARFSSMPQEDGSSEERQIEGRRARAAALGADFVDVYIDRGKSGYYAHHLDGDLGRMIEDVRSGKIPRGDIIGVDTHSRLGRMPPGDQIMQFFGFLKAGIALDIGDGQKSNLRTWASINGEQGLPTLMMDLIDIFTAHKESLDKSTMGVKTNRIKRDKLRAGRQEAMKTGAGWFVGNRCPAWLRAVRVPINGYLYEIDERFAPIIRMIFRWADSGIGQYVIARRLNEKGVEPLANKHRKKNRVIGWSPSMVGGVLRSRAIIGEYQPKIRENAKNSDGNPIWGKRVKVRDGEAIAGYYPPLFPDDPHLFWRVQVRLRNNDRTGGKGRNGVGYANLPEWQIVCEPPRPSSTQPLMPRKGMTHAPSSTVCSAITSSSCCAVVVTGSVLG